ncbi:MAG: nitrate reductase cytochrome c-type subunit [Hydrogenophilaceae bacterium]|nr:nitrate reductase cytochrome c-type subunit [Hydrogenophilaceae bacterium]
MRTIALVGTALALGLAAQWGQAADQPIPDDQLGLSKTSVYEVPDPQTFEYRQADPFSGGTLPRAYLGAPPQVPHEIKDFVPITLESNMCVGCHQQPDMVGKKKVKGQPTPLPASHYVDVKANTMHMGRYNCTQCHTPQATVKPLVDNTFGKKKTK